MQHLVSFSPLYTLVRDALLTNVEGHLPLAEAVLLEPFSTPPVLSIVRHFQVSPRLHPAARRLFLPEVCPCYPDVGQPEPGEGAGTERADFKWLPRFLSSSRLHREVLYHFWSNFVIVSSLLHFVLPTFSTKSSNIH